MGEIDLFLSKLNKLTIKFSLSTFRLLTQTDRVICLVPPSLLTEFLS